MSFDFEFPESKGTYCIFFETGTFSFKVKSGKRFSLEEGIYVYVGSAFGTGGLRKRILRHLKKEKRKHWHFDFITTHSSFKPIEIWLFRGKRIECKIASFLENVTIPIFGFGSTDCNCSSHLFKVQSIRSVYNRLREAFKIDVIKLTEEE